MDLLWEKGIESTSISDLCEHMGIGKASLYGTFGSKEKLIFEAMDCYVSLMKGKILSSLAQDGPARAGRWAALTRYDYQLAIYMARRR